MKRIFSLLAAGVICGLSAVAASSETLPKALTSRVPRGYQIASFRSADFNGDGLKDFAVIAVSHKEKDSSLQSSDDAPKRLVLVYFGKRAASDLEFELVAQNDSLALPANGGGVAGPCDPIFDEGDGLAVKDGYLTIENQVACGAHWTDYITFKYSPSAQAMVFHKRISEVSGLVDKTSEFGVIHREVERAGVKRVLLQDYKAF